MDASGILATVDAVLVSLATIAMVVGYRAIRRGKPRLHRNAMLSAFALSTLFLVCFVVRLVRFGITEMRAVGALRVVYYVVWFTHEPIAVLSVPLVVAALVLALRRRIDLHREVAPIAFFVWLYSAISGVLVYVLLYLV